LIRWKDWKDRGAHEWLSRTTAVYGLDERGQNILFYMGIIGLFVLFGATIWVLWTMA
jgi:hypothetical protein